MAVSVSLPNVPSVIDGDTSRARAAWKKKYAERIAEVIEGRGRFLEDYEGIQAAWDDGLAYMTVLLDCEGGVAWLSLDTFKTITQHEEAGDRFSDDLHQWGAGMKYLMTEATAYRNAASNRAAAVGVPPQGVDPLTQLEMDAKALLVSVATADGEFSELQMRMFAERLGDVQGRRRALTAQMERLDSYVDLAAVALMDH